MFAGTYNVCHVNAYGVRTSCEHTKYHTYDQSLIQLVNLLWSVYTNIPPKLKDYQIDTYKLNRHSTFCFGAKAVWYQHAGAAKQFTFSTYSWGLNGGWKMTGDTHRLYFTFENCFRFPWSITLAQPSPRLWNQHIELNSNILLTIFTFIIMTFTEYRDSERSCYRFFFFSLVSKYYKYNKNKKHEALQIRCETSGPKILFEERSKRSFSPVEKRNWAILISLLIPKNAHYNSGWQRFTSVILHV